MVVHPLPLPLTVVNLLCQHCQLSESMLQGGVVRVWGSSVFQKVLDEEHIAWNSLDWLNEKVIQGQLSLIVPCPLLFREGWKKGEERVEEMEGGTVLR